MGEKEFASPVSSRTTWDMGPLLPQERIDVVDILRGWAILGMLVVNMSHDLGYGYLFTKLWPDTADRVAYFLLHFFAKGKFYSLFAFLFGWGFALQMGRAEARGVRFFPLYARRLFVLLLIGLANLVFGFSVLFEYALLGYVLFLFRRRSLKTILVAALLCTCYWPVRNVYDGIVSQNHAHRLADPRTAEVTRQADAQAQAAAIALGARKEQHFRVHSQGSFREIVAMDAREVARELSSGFRRGGFAELLANPFPLLLLGLYVGRRRILQDVTAHLAFIRRVFWWGLSLGLVGNGVDVLLSDYPGGPYYNAPWSWERSIASLIGVPALGFFYASAIVLLAQRPSWKLRLAPLAPVGRMALSNYLLQVFIVTVLFYGLGFYARVGPFLGVGLGLLIFTLEVVLSTFWMRRFRFGPVEWLWRTLTYGRLQPMRAPTRAMSTSA